MSRLRYSARTHRPCQLCARCFSHGFWQWVDRVFTRLVVPRTGAVRKVYFWHAAATPATDHDDRHSRDGVSTDPVQSERQRTARALHPDPEDDLAFIAAVTLNRGGRVWGWSSCSRPFSAWATSRPLTPLPPRLIQHLATVDGRTAHTTTSSSSMSSERLRRVARPADS